MANNNENKVLNVPPLRFPEFTEEWVTKSINDLAVVIGGGTPDTTVKSYWDGEIQWFTPSEIGKNKYVDSSLRTITEVGLNNSSAKLLPPNTILLSSRATIGECSLSLRECATNQGFQCLVSKKCNVDFLYYLIQTKKKDLIRKSCGSTFLEISANEVRKIQVSVPSDVEQQKIAELLSLIDERIATQNKIIEKLQSLIKGIVVSHYSTTAHIIKVRIRELGEAYSTMVMSKEQLTNDGNLCVFYGELFTLYGCVIDEVKSRTSLEKVSSTLSHGRDLLFPASTTVDAVSLIAPSALMQKDIILGGDMFGIKVSEAYNPIYLSYYFNYIANKRLAKYAKGTTIIHLHYNEIANVAIELPNIEEQDKIVSTILEYSAKLSIEETILEKLFDLKQYLLKQLFI